MKKLEDDAYAVGYDDAKQKIQDIVKYEMDMYQNIVNSSESQTERTLNRCFIEIIGRLEAKIKEA